MSDAWAGEERAEVAASARWQRAADRLARYGWLVLLVSIAIALAGGTLTAIIWQPADPTRVVTDVCENPPCFDIGGMPRPHDYPMVVTTLGYLMAILLGVPSLLAAAWDFPRGRWALGGRRLLPFIGPVLFFIGTEILPHLLNPCFFVLEFSGRRLPGICEFSPEWGADLADRWHLLDHTLVGALPMAALYWLALRKWHPGVARFRTPA